MGDEPNEFTAFYAANRAWLRSFAFTLCSDAHEAEDLTQTAFLRILNRWSALDRERELRGYLKRVLRSVYIDSRRRAATTRERLVAEPPEPQRSSAWVVSSELETTAHLVADLPTAQRYAVFLRFWADLDVRETARHLRCKPGTATSHTSRALASLRAKLTTHQPTVITT